MRPNMSGTLKPRPASVSIWFQPDQPRSKCTVTTAT